jgi:lipopolysaccharide transport system permease protein
MLQNLANLFRARELLEAIVLRDVKVRYKQSVMGLLWAILMPVIIVAAGVLARLGMSIFANKPFDHSQIASIVVKSVPWAFFVSSIRFSTSSLTGNWNLVTKLAFPKEIFPIAAVISCGFDFLVASAVLIIIGAVLRVPLGWAALWVPVALLLLLSLCVSIGLVLSAMNLFFRDVRHIVEVVLTFAIFFSPVFFDVDMFGRWKSYLLLNPVAPLLEAIRSSLVSRSTPDLFWLTYSATISLCALPLSYLFFKSQESKFAEYI